MARREKVTKREREEERECESGGRRKAKKDFLFFLKKKDA